MRSLAPLALLCITAPLGAATFVVSNGGDSGTGSLRWAIEQSNATPGRDEIEWNGALTVTLQSQLPPITDPVTIGVNPLPYWGSNVPQPQPLTIDGSQTSGDGLRVSAGDVVVSNVGLAHFKSGDAVGSTGPTRSSPGSSRTTRSTACAFMASAPASTARSSTTIRLPACSSSLRAATTRSGG